MSVINFFGLIDEEILNKVLRYHHALAKHRKKNLFQLNITCTKNQFEKYIRENFNFEYEFTGKIIHDEKEFKVYLYSIVLDYVRVNILVSDYYETREKIKADPIYDENYSAIQDYIMNPKKEN